METLVVAKFINVAKLGVPLPVFYVDGIRVQEYAPLDRVDASG